MNEQTQLSRIRSLMNDWKKEVASAKVVFREDGKTYRGDEYFCSDGFFPYYYSQKRRVLFIGRETVGMSGMDYIETLYKAYKANSIADKTLDQHFFHNRMFYLAYGIINDGKIPYTKVPYASEMAKTFGEPGGISFAFMELSKYSNDNDDANAHCDTTLMNAFLRDSHLEKRNFVQEELSILDPDIIITMNLWGAGVDGGLLELALGKMDDSYAKYNQPTAACYKIQINGRPRPLIDLYHFSSRKNTEKDFYNPVMEIARKFWLGEESSRKERRKMITERIKARKIPEEWKKVDSAAFIREMREERMNQIMNAIGDIDDRRS